MVLGTGMGFAPTFGATIEDIEKLISCEMQPTKVPSFGCVCGHRGLIPLRRASGVALPLFKTPKQLCFQLTKSVAICEQKNEAKGRSREWGIKGACAEDFN